jgi:hypothetical protein
MVAGSPGECSSAALGAADEYVTATRFGTTSLEELLAALDVVRESSESPFADCPGVRVRYRLRRRSGGGMPDFADSAKPGVNSTSCNLRKLLILRSIRPQI